jgi:hypothetical protein
MQIYVCVRREHSRRACGDSIRCRVFNQTKGHLRWTKDGSVWILNTSSINSANIFKVNLATGSRQLWKEIHVGSLSQMLFGVITADGNTFVDNEYASSGTLRRVSGLR